MASEAPSATGVTYEAGPRFRTTLVRDAGTTAWATPHGGVSFAGLLVEIAPD